MTSLLLPEHLTALATIAAVTVALVVLARRRPGRWLHAFAAVLVVDEVSWWVWLLAGKQPGAAFASSLPLQLCDVAIFVAAAALSTRSRLLAEWTYFWALAGTVQALLTPDLPAHFPNYPYFQYYIAHGGVVAAAFVLVIGLRIAPRPWSAVRVFAITVAYAAVVGVLDAVLGANYMYLRSKPPSPTLLDAFGPWPLYIAVGAALAAAFFAILDAPFRIRRAQP
jgi:hypothetical integral membrane protein (TIGR02206 family)